MLYYIAEGQIPMENERYQQVLENQELLLVQNKDVQEILEQVQREAFMEGHRYAIEVLKENIVK